MLTITSHREQQFRLGGGVTSVAGSKSEGGDIRQGGLKLAKVSSSLNHGLLEPGEKLSVLAFSTRDLIRDEVTSSCLACPAGQKEMK